MKHIAIFTHGVPDHPPWDPDSIHSGITGSEEAVIFMAKELARLGYRVTVFGHPPRGSSHALDGANPRYVSHEHTIDRPFDITVCWRWPTIGSLIREKGLAKKIYLWPHDTLDESTSSEGFDDVLWLSEWQREQWVSVCPAFARFTKIFGNGIDPGQFQPPQSRQNPYSCIYGSNYARGLEVLLRIWPTIKEHFPLATLAIYYGWQHWGLLPPERETWMRDAIERLPDVQEHGLVSHEELNRAYAKTSFWTYPCIMPETFCITALRAQLSGAVPVILEGSALRRTVRSGFKCQRLEDYPRLLLLALSKAEAIAEDARASLGRFVLEEYTWEKMARRWHELFNSYG